MAALVAHLAKVVIFRGLIPGQLELIVGISALEEFPRGSVIFTEGEPGEGLYLIVKGKVQITRKWPMGGHETLAELEPGDAFGGNQATSKRPATSTTVNAAFALGPAGESTSSYNNGGVENHIRFLEDWSGKTITYNGSIVALWHSQQATGAHRCCGDSGDNYYQAPNRNWAYDTLFNTTPPPGTPMGIVTMRGQWSEG